jgi:hypothetical protein
MDGPFHFATNPSGPLRPQVAAMELCRGLRGLVVVTGHGRDDDGPDEACLRLRPEEDCFHCETGVRYGPDAVPVGRYKVSGSSPTMSATVSMLFPASTSSETAVWRRM